MSCIRRPKMKSNVRWDHLFKGKSLPCSVFYIIGTLGWISKYVASYARRSKMLKVLNLSSIGRLSICLWEETSATRSLRAPPVNASRHLCQQALLLDRNISAICGAFIGVFYVWNRSPYRMKKGWKRPLDLKRVRSLVRIETLSSSMTSRSYWRTSSRLEVGWIRWFTVAWTVHTLQHRHCMTQRADRRRCPLVLKNYSRLRM